MVKLKVVLEVSWEDKKKFSKALKVVVGCPGVESASVERAQHRMVVIGEGIDAVAITFMLRKRVGYVQLVSVGPAEKKEEKKEPAVMKEGNKFDRKGWSLIDFLTRKKKQEKKETRQEGESSSVRLVEEDEETKQEGEAKSFRPVEKKVEKETKQEGEAMSFGPVEKKEEKKETRQQGEVKSVRLVEKKEEKMETKQEGEAKSFGPVEKKEETETKQEGEAKSVRPVILPSLPVLPLEHYEMSWPIGLSNKEILHKDSMQQFENTVGLPVMSSQVNKSTVHGRQNDKNRVIELLLSGDCWDRNVSVIRLVAAGGVGKTTLAHLVYTDYQVCDNFDTRAWVCVTERLDVKGLTKAIIESLTGISCGLTELSELQETVREELMGNRFLIVLDNVCNEDLRFWSSLLIPLSVGANGSIVMVTTRNEMVANIMGMMYSYYLNRLSEFNCFLVFQQHAFEGRDPNILPDLTELGELVTKCEGIPLASKALGGLLCSATNEISWKAVLESDLWDTEETLPALKLSFEHLPMHLKRCFKYCSLFPKGYLFEKDHLARLWMSQGFVEPKEGKRVEDIGIEYFDELCRRSFFQYSPIYHPKEGKYVMHDLFHDLAQSLSVNECFRTKDCKLSSIPEKVHHASFVPYKFETVIQFESFKESRDLHTFLLINRSALEWDGSQFHFENLAILDDFFTRFRCLRTLDLSFSNIKVLPDSVANLNHLCYLGLNYTDIKRLPESICSLYNLQTLELKGCDCLCELPKYTKNLASLRHLDMGKLSGFVCMPPGIGQLTNLLTLSTFNVGGDKWYCGIEELKNLVNLRRRLCIGGLENVIHGKDATEANLKNKGYLQTLTLQWSNSWGDLEGDESAETAGEVLRSLQPHNNLEELIIRDYFGGRFPSWMGDPSFSKLISITLDNCYECDILPPLGQLPSLRHLSIRRMVSVQRLGPEFCGSDTMVMNVFPSLKTLKLWEMSELEEWCGVKDGDFPCLHSLSISRCPRLRRLPRFTSLMELSVHSCTQLPDFPTLPSLVFLKIEGFQSLTSLALPLDLSALKMLEINHCNQLSSVGGLSHLASIEQLKVIRCPKLHFSSSEQLPSMLQVVDIRRGCPLLSKWCPYGFVVIADAQQACRMLLREEKHDGKFH